MSLVPVPRRSLVAGFVAVALGAGATLPAAHAVAAPDKKPAKSAASAQGKKAAKGKKRAKKRPAIYKRCGASRSSKKLAKQTVKRYRSGTTTTTRIYCDGSRRITTKYPKSPPKVVFVPAPAPGQPAPQPQPQPTPAKPGFRLTLLHNNDGESKYKVGDSVNGYGGVAHFKTVLDRLRGEASSYTDAEVRSGAMRTGTVTVSSGDNFLAGLNLRASFERRDAGQGPLYDAVALREIGYDALTIGNHEYDFGPTRLAQLISDMPAGVPFLSANTDFSGASALQTLVDSGRIAKSTVVEKGGEKIGIIGVSPPETPSVSSPGAVTFSSAVAEAVNGEAQKLTAAGVNKVILSSHLQNVANERNVVAQLRNVDVVIAGGGDDLLADADDRLLPAPNNVAVGPYPTIAKDADGATVPIVTTQGEYRYVGRLTALFDSAGKLTAIDDTTSGPVRVSATPADSDVAAADPALQASVVQPLTAYSAALAANVIGTTDVALNGGNPNPIRQQESNLGDLVADAFRYTTNKAQTAAGGPAAQVAFSNGGGIRTSIPAGNISEKSTFDVLPFDNSMVTVTDVTPERFKRLMEHGVAFFSPQAASNGRFPQISGFRMTVDRSQTAQVLDAAGNVTTPGARIRELTLADGTKIVESGALVPGAPNVNIATTNFTAGQSTGGAGGDGYPFQGLPIRSAIRNGGFVPYQQTLLEYITDPVSSSVAGQTGLGGKVTTTTHPGTGRITFAG